MHVGGKSQLPHTTYGRWQWMGNTELSVYDRLGCDVIGLQETRRSGHSAFSQAGYVVYCSGECGDENGGKKGQSGVGLAVRTSITRDARPPEFISDRLLKVTLELRGRAKAVTFFVAYAPTEIHDASKKHAFWTTLDRAVKDVPRHEQLLRLHLNYVVEPKPLRFLSRMLQLRYMMLVRNMHFGQPWTEL